jgi:hypothetical protein
MANILDEILAELQGIRAALESGAGAAAPAKPDKAKPDKAKPKEPEVSLETVQNKIRELAKDDAMKGKIKAAIEALGAKRAGDLEGEPAKLAKLDKALDELAAGDSGGEDDDDLL